jgi:hypothetical protein
MKVVIYFYNEQVVDAQVLPIMLHNLIELELWKLEANGRTDAPLSCEEVVQEYSLKLKPYGQRLGAVVD